MKRRRAGKKPGLAAQFDTASAAVCAIFAAALLIALLTRGAGAYLEDLAGFIERLRPAAECPAAATVPYREVGA